MSIIYEVGALLYSGTYTATLEIFLLISLPYYIWLLSQIRVLSHYCIWLLFQISVLYDILCLVLIQYNLRSEVLYSGV